MDPITVAALDAMVVGDAVGEIAAPLQYGVLALLVLSAVWASRRPNAAALTGFLACALVWCRANHALEGQVLLTLTTDHGLTTADLLPPALVALVLARWSE
jgi:hypothetical protein